MKDEDLILKIKMMKAKGIIKNYYEVSKEIGLTEKSFYNWLGGYYKLGYTKKQNLINYIKENDL